MLKKVGQNWNIIYIVWSSLMHLDGLRYTELNVQIIEVKIKSFFKKHFNHITKNAKICSKI